MQYEKYKGKYMKKYKLHEWISEGKITVIGLAKICDCSTQTIYNWSWLDKNDERSIPGDALKKISEHMGVTMEEMYNENTQY